MNWISVNERMPDDDTIVMVHAPGENEPVWLGYHSGEDGWRLVEGFDTKVTHWMDLPCVPTVDAIREGVKLAGGVQQEQPPAQQHEQQGGKPLFVCNDKHEIGFGNDDDAIHLMDCVDSRILTNTLNAAVAAHTEKLRQRIAELELAGGVE